MHFMNILVQNVIYTRSQPEIKQTIRIQSIKRNRQTQPLQNVKICQCQIESTLKKKNPSPARSLS